MSIVFRDFEEWGEIKREENGGVLSKASSAVMRGTSSRMNLRENKTLLVNPNCYIRILIDYVGAQVNFDFSSATFDLCNESGELLKVCDVKPCEYATGILLFQKTYIVVKCLRSDEGVLKSLQPLIYKNSKEYLEVMPRLKKYIPSSRRLLERQRSKKSTDELRSYSSRERRRSADENSRISTRGSRRTLPSPITSKSGSVVRTQSYSARQ